MLGQLVGTLRHSHEPCCTGGRLGANRRCELHLLPPHASIHWQTQSYFLSSTDAAGAPLRWDMLARMETVGTADDALQPALERILAATGVRGGGSLPHENSKQKKESLPRNTPTSCGGCATSEAMCDPCAIRTDTISAAFRRRAGARKCMRKLSAAHRQRPNAGE